jgi:hypothetical protein
VYRFIRRPVKSRARGTRRRVGPGELEPTLGLEPRTGGLQNRCSAN